jgi:hypothetical protein
MLRRLLPALLLSTFALLETARAAERPLSAFDRVDIAPTKTSIYVGSVSMTTPTFARKAGVYEATYVAKVFPYFFSSEKGAMSITLSDETLRKLEKGETVEFTGRATNTDGEERRIEGKATPADPLSGKIKVRVYVSKRIELIFNTTYRFDAK